MYCVYVCVHFWPIYPDVRLGLVILFNPFHLQLTLRDGSGELGEPPVTLPTVSSANNSAGMVFYYIFDALGGTAFLVLLYL